MLEAIVIIIALGGLEIALWWSDHKRQEEQLATLEAIWVELALLNEEKPLASAGQTSAVSQECSVDLAPVRPVPTPVTH